jgi:hypothetical protein
MIEEGVRPPLVAEAEWQDTEQIGAAYAHTYYPAYIDIVPNVAFITPINSKPVYIHIVRHLKALEVTDFDNSLYEEPKGDLLLPMIRKPINGVQPDRVVSMNGKDAWDGYGIVMAQEWSLAGKIFRNTSYTEIVVGWEIRETRQAGNLHIFYEALRKLLYTYRYLTPDLRARLGPALKAHVPTIRRGVCNYKNPRAPVALDRLRDNEPRHWRLDTLSFKEYVGGVASHSSRFGNLEQRTTNIGSYLMDGFVLPDTIAALEAVAEECLQSGNYRIAIVEAISLAEMTILAAWRRLHDNITIRRNIDATDGHTLKFLFEKLLPIILSFYDGDRGPLLGHLRSAVQIRHRVVHGGFRPVAEEADKVLSTVRRLILIIEIPNKYKRDWQLKPRLPAPVPIEPQTSF